jgi:hypothetical protein
VKKFILTIVVVLCLSLPFIIIEMKHTDKDDFYCQNFSKTSSETSVIPIDRLFNAFFYPDLKKYQTDVSALYKNRDYNSIWYDKNL